jgi:hypothetical protein
MCSLLKRAAVLLVVGLLVAGIPVHAQEFAKVGTAGAKFLEIPVGARGVAIGNAYSALSNDATAMFWNPAGLVQVQGANVWVERTAYLADMSYNALGVAYSVNGFWTVGLFGGSLNSGDIDRTTVEQPLGTGESFTVNNLVAGVSVATRLTDKFSFGANIKFVREDLDAEVSNAYAIDVGTMYDTRWNTVRISMNVRNFGPEIQLDGQYYDYDNGILQDEPSEYLEYHFPMIFRLGIAMDPIRTAMHRLTVLGELEHPNDNIERVNIGGEYGFQEMFFLRGGYTFRHDTLGMSAGLGLVFSGFGIDYAYSDYGVLDEVHRFNVKFSF